MSYLSCSHMAQNHGLSKKLLFNVKQKLKSYHLSLVLCIKLFM